MSEFPLLEKYLYERINPPVTPKVVSIRLGWFRKVEGRGITLHGRFTGFERGECQISDQPNLAAPMTEQLAKKVLHRVRSKYLKSVIEDSLSMVGETRTDLRQVGFADSLEAVRDSVRNAIADGLSRDEILAVCNHAVNG